MTYTVTYIDKISRTLTSMKPASALLTVNVAVFVVLHLIAIAIRLEWIDTTIDNVISGLTLPGSWPDFSGRWWTIVTYMFVHYDALHLIMNMLWLYMFASFLYGIVSNRRIYMLYFAGGISGAIVYMLYGLGSGAIGASASVIAIMATAMFMIPTLQVRLLFFGETSLRIVGLIVILIVVIGSGTDNVGAHVIHAGGFVAGMILGIAWRRGKSGRRKGTVSRPVVADRTSPLNSVSVQTDKQSEPKPDDTLDSLLDKIRISGYASLTDEERRRLFKISSTLQNREK